MRESVDNGPSSITSVEGYAPSGDTVKGGLAGEQAQSEAVVSSRRRRWCCCEIPPALG